MTAGLECTLQPVIESNCTINYLIRPGGSWREIVPDASSLLGFGTTKGFLPLQGNYK